MGVSKKFKNQLYEIRPIADLKEMIKSSAQLYGDRKAFLVKNKPGGKYIPVSFKQVKQDVDALGTALLDLGLAGERIAVIGENRYEWVISYLAVVCGTGVVVPLDKELPEAEIKNLIQQSKATTVIYSGKVEKLLKSAVEGLDFVQHLISMDAETDDGERYSWKVLLDRGNKLIDQEMKRFINAQIDPEAMSILLFTSGTTGLAKGVMLSHKNICANVMNMSMYVEITGDDVGLSILPMHHTYELTCHVMTVLYQGGCVAICEGLKHIVKNLGESKATVLVGVPLVFESMHKNVWKQAEKTGQADKLRKAVTVSKALNKFNIKSARKLFKSVHQAFGGNIRMFISGAAALDPMIIEDFNYMGINMFQGYGLTENAPIVAVCRDRYHKPKSVGEPMPNTEVRLADTDEDGVGEIIVKGDSVMLGYYENDEETAKVLRDGWLYTGDYGYFDKDGFLYISGRKKNVIVTKNGKNIFPEEVEYYLGKSDYVLESIVTGDLVKDGDLSINAQIVPDYVYISETHGELSKEDMQALFKQVVSETNDNMSPYKRIKKFELRAEEFEKTSTKKVKRFGANVES